MGFILYKLKKVFSQHISLEIHAIIKSLQFEISNINAYAF